MAIGMFIMFLNSSGAFAGGPATICNLSMFGSTNNVMAIQVDGCERTKDINENTWIKLGGVNYEDQILVATTAMIANKRVLVSVMDTKIGVTVRKIAVIR